MKYMVTGFIAVKIEVDALSEKDAIVQASTLFDVDEFVSYKTPEAQFKKAVLVEEDDGLEDSYNEEEDDEE